MNSSTQSTADRPLALRARRDVLAVAVPVGGTATWVVKDPLTLEQYQLSEVDYVLLDALAEKQSLRDLQHLLQHRFAPQQFSREQIWRQLSQLHQAGLLVGELPGQGAALGQRDQERRRQRLKWSWSELLAVRLRGWDPDRALDWLYPAIKPLFHPISLMLAGVFVLAALMLVATNFGEFVARLPALGALLAMENWTWLVLTIAVVKVLHEFGHALAAKHFGGEVHEMGVLFLVFVPCLYCDVSDVWKLPSRWQRMAVGAAGMAVEMTMAAIATFVWWFSEPGLLNLLALNAIVVASVGTLFVNGNPLLRYDGYYLLSDLADVPNLWQRSRSAVRERLGKVFFSPLSQSKQSADAAPKESIWLAAYGVASSFYLAAVLFGIFWLAITALSPVRLQVLAYLLGGVMIAGVSAGPVRQTAKTILNPLRRRQLSPWRSTIAVAIVAILAATAWRWPIADRVTVDATIVPARAETVVTTLPGRLTYIAPAGSQVAAGEVIAKLASADVELQEERLRGEVELAKARLAGLEALRGRDPQANDQLPTAQTELTEAQRRLDEHRREAERLVLRATVDGVVLPPPRVPAAESQITLATWSGTLLDTNNAGAWVESGTAVALVGEPNAVEILVSIDETDIELVEVGQRVRVQLDASGGDVLEGEVVDVAQRGNDGDRHAISPGVMPNNLDDSPQYEARVVLDEVPPAMPFDSGGRAKIESGHTTIGKWAVRELRDAFRLP